MLEALEQLRAWKRYFRRAQELKIATPDATLLVGALEKYVEQSSRPRLKHSSGLTLQERV